MPQEAEKTTEVDQKEAVYQCIRSEFKRVGKFAKITNGISSVNIVLSRHLAFKYLGRLHFVTVQQLCDFGSELIEKGVISAYRPFDVGVTFAVSKSGIDVLFEPESQYQDPTTNGRTGGALIFQKVESGVLPTSKALLLPVLFVLNIGPEKKKSLQTKVAKLLGFPIGDVSLSIPRGSNATFAVYVGNAVDYLHRKGFVNRLKKDVEITEFGRARLLSDKQDYWPDFKEPKFRIKPVETRENLARFTGKINSHPIVEKLPRMSLHEIKAVWQNAIRILSNSSGNKPHEAVYGVLAAIEHEWSRRSTSTKPGDYFKWPSADARSGNGSLQLDSTHSEGMLAYLEYRVGKTHGQHSSVRQSILSRVFEGALPPVFDREYMKTWGSSKSAERLRKMAECIAAFTRNAKRRNDDRFDEAIKQWEQDLRFLYDRYYVGKFNFGWPITKID